MDKGLDLYCEKTQSFADQRAGHGILVITLSGRILWTDARARYLCQQMRVVTEEQDETLPPAVIKIAKEIAELLDLRNHPKDWEEFNVKRVIKGREGHIFVAAIGLPAGVGHDTESTVFFTLDVISARKSVSRLEEFQLTPREVAVVGFLLKGLTNKEIAKAINVTVQTTKEHIKHIMEKTRTSTRTGVVMAIAAPAENVISR
ncbi:MAG TPA: helix-turn-helix transcriptional regulator [Nitrospirales bacterium]